MRERERSTRQRQTPSKAGQEHLNIKTMSSSSLSWALYSTKVCFFILTSLLSPLDQLRSFPFASAHKGETSCEIRGQERKEEMKSITYNSITYYSIRREVSVSFILFSVSRKIKKNKKNKKSTKRKTARFLTAPTSILDHTKHSQPKNEPP